MSKRYTIAISLVYWILAGPVSTALFASPQESRPNLLVIVADDHAAWTLGSDGDPNRATPNLDALARQGTLFQRAYCNSPVCTPSRQSLITGKLPHSIGVTQLSTRLSDDVLTIGQWLRDRNYATIAIGKMHFNGPSKHGFDVRIDTPEWERSLREHRPRGGDRAAAMAADPGPGPRVAQFRRPACGTAGRVDAVNVFRGSSDCVPQAKARATVRDDRQLL